MIIESRVRHKPGDKLMIPEYEIGATNFVPGVVLREVTWEEYIADVLPCIPENEHDRYDKPVTGCRWYLVSTD